MAGIGDYKKGGKFTLKSGNKPTFKMMGSSKVEEMKKFSKNVSAAGARSKELLDQEAYQKHHEKLLKQGFTPKDADEMIKSGATTGEVKDSSPAKHDLTRGKTDADTKAGIGLKPVPHTHDIEKHPVYGHDRGVINYADGAKTRDADWWKGLSKEEQRKIRRNKKAKGYDHAETMKKREESKKTEESSPTKYEKDPKDFAKRKEAEKNEKLRNKFMKTLSDQELKNLLKKEKKPVSPDTTGIEWYYTKGKMQEGENIDEID